MSQSSDTVGVAYIDVETLTTVTVTRRVKTAGGAVIWKVQNFTSSDVTVCLENFTPHRGIAPGLSTGNAWLLPDGKCTRSLGRGDRGVIVGIFNGTPGDVYDYDVYVNGTRATDPQLEI
jgi:hypothetical protein